jgi:hypothetical protein
MDWLKQLNLKEIAYIADRFGISYSGGFFRIGKSFSVNDVYETIQFFKNQIWNQINVQKAIDIARRENNSGVLYYWQPEQLEPIDDFLGKLGVFDYKVAISDPLSWLCSTNPYSEHSPDRDPEAYIRMVLEHGLYLVGLAEWIETDQLLLLPDIHLWDYVSWVELGKLNEEIFNEYKLESSPIGKELFRISAFEKGVHSVMEMLRLLQNNSSIENIKRAIPSIDDEKAVKVLNYFKKLPKETRDIQAVKFLAEKYEIDNDGVEKKINLLKKQSIYDLENYIDISKLNRRISIMHSMPLTLALYMGDSLGMVPITDQKLNKMTFDLYAQVIKLTDDYKDKRELIESKVELQVPFIKNLSPKFVFEQKKSGASYKLKDFLNNRWSKIKNEKNSTSFLSEVGDFSKSINSDYQNIKNELLQSRKELALKIGKSAITAGGIFAEEAIRNDFWMAAAKSIPILLGGSMKSYKEYNKEKFKLKKNPLFIFID